MFNEKLKSLRKSVNKNQTDIAFLFNVNQTTYGKWENGTSTPYIYTVKELANYFGVSIDYLLDNEKNSSHIYKETIEIKKAMDNVDEGTRQRMLEMLKFAFLQAFDKYTWALGV